MKKKRHQKILKYLAITVLSALALVILGRIEGYVVLSGSMEPSIPTGSICCVDTGVPAEDIRQGDVIAYRLSNEVRVLHRVIEVDENEKQFITKGDANECEDFSPVSFGQYIGKERGVLPFLGYVTAWTKESVGIHAQAVSEPVKMPEESDSEESDSEESDSQEADSEEAEPEGPVTNTEEPEYLFAENIDSEYQRGDPRLRTAVGTSVHVKLMAAPVIFIDQTNNAAIKYIEEDADTADMKGKSRTVYCADYKKAAPTDEIHYTGNVNNKMAYVMYYGCRYLNQPSVWANYSTGLGWKYDYLATQWTVHILNGELTIADLNNMLLPEFKSTGAQKGFYQAVQKMISGANNYGSSFTGGYKGSTWVTNNPSKTAWEEYTYQKEEGYVTAWITQDFKDKDNISQPEYLGKRSVSVPEGTQAIWSDGSNSASCRLWIPKALYEEYQRTGKTLTLTLGGVHPSGLNAWQYSPTQDNRQPISFIEAYTATEAHSKSFDFQIVQVEPEALNLTIRKTIREDEIWWEHGVPVFLFSVTGTDYLGKSHKYEEIIAFEADKIITDSEGKVTLEVCIERIPSGNYMVKELLTQRYEPEGDTEISVELKDKDELVQFYNRKEKYDKFIHDCYIVNKFSI